MPSISPWHQLTTEQLAKPAHDPRTCPVCAPAFTPPADAGIAQARLEAQAVQ